MELHLSSPHSAFRFHPLNSTRAACLVAVLFLLWPTTPLTAQAPAANPMKDAFAAVAELKSAAETGVPRTQWDGRLQAAIPRVRKFTQPSPTEWPDVKASLELAVDKYRSALNDWESASLYFKEASQALRYAEDRAAQPAERSPRETPAETVQLGFGAPKPGRLGFGDATLPGGRYAKMFSISVASKSNVRFTMDCFPANDCTTTVTGTDGNAIALIRDYDSEVEGDLYRTSKPLVPGSYRVRLEGTVGLFMFTASAVK